MPSPQSYVTFQLSERSERVSSDFYCEIVMMCIIVHCIAVQMVEHQLPVLFFGAKVKFKV